MSVYQRYKQFMMDRYGAPLYRVPIDPGFGCPNRDENGSGGCAFCPADGSRAHQTAAATSLEEQIRLGMDFARNRYGARRFMAYIQAFTGTFAPADRQRDLYERVLATFPFEAISVGTRPDCLSDETLDVLAAVRERAEVWVELGIQTIHDETLERINRGHDWACSRRAVSRLKARRLRVVAHVILGLPGETPRHFEETAEILAGLPIDGFKIHNLHVVAGTPLETAFRSAPFPTFDEREYAAVLAAFLRRLPPHVPILRLCTDTPEAELVAPRWRLSKSQFLNMLEQEMTCNGWRQGDLWQPTR